jgi:hypothetical protein
MRRVVGQAKKFAQEVAAGLKRAKGLLKQVSLEADRVYLERMIPLEAPRAPANVSHRYKRNSAPSSCCVPERCKSA